MSLGPAEKLDFDRLYERYGGLVYSTVATILADHQRAEDAFQEVFLRVARATERGIVPEFPESWLLTISRREAWRLLPRRRPAPIEDDPPAPATPDPVVRSEEDRLVRAALRSMEPAERRILLLAYLADLDRVEICRRLGLTRSTFFRRLDEARNTLRKLLPGPLAGHRIDKGRHDLP
ncbi:MAG: sigma-70 family RNA polymerase sigma factor [Planctomycetes bacterium]|jgi:RNA polymerase sigma-70 factor (ECF subfamily)|nr:sigma-70 family RNA polymerase sigma factor [Planctomycetota bacterium]